MTAATKTLRQIVVFWVGADVTTPSLLVRSIRRAMGDDMNVVQVSDASTPEISGVSRCEKLPLSKHIMVARLEAYASLPVREPTLYLDADMLVVRDFDLPDLDDKEIGVTRRVLDIAMNWRYPLEFPEFKDRTAMQVMPFLYSFIYTRSQRLFERQLEALLKMPQRFQEWYGDQVTLKSELESGSRFVPRLFDMNVYNATIKSPDDVTRAAMSGVCVAHFKGGAAKAMMAPALDWLSRALR